MEHGLGDARSDPPITPPVGSSVRVQKRRPDGSLVLAWDGTVLRADPRGVVLQAVFNVDLWDVSSLLTLRRGDIFVEFYYWNRWYNVFQVAAPDGTLKGWYCNLALPLTREPGTGDLLYVDLALDVVAGPHLDYEILDEDEYLAYLEQELDLTRRDACQQARQELEALARAGRLPRWPESAPATAHS